MDFRFSNFDFQISIFKFRISNETIVVFNMQAAPGAIEFVNQKGHKSQVLAINRKS